MEREREREMVRDERVKERERERERDLIVTIICGYYGILRIFANRKKSQY